MLDVYRHAFSAYSKHEDLHFERFDHTVYNLHVNKHWKTIRFIIPYTPVPFEQDTTMQYGNFIFRAAHRASWYNGEVEWHVVIWNEPPCLLHFRGPFEEHVLG